MSNVHINAEIRQAQGKAEVGRIRQKGMVPCIMYGVDDTTIQLSIEHLALEKLLSASYSVIDLKYDGKTQGVVVRDIQYHPVKGNIIHVDFMRIKAGQEIKISVPIKFVGEPEGVKVGGVYQELKSELEITTLPRNLPEFIEVDISALEINDAIYVRDVVVENITIEEDPNDLVCSVIPPTKEEEPEVELDEEGEELEVEESEEEPKEPEVITSKKSEPEE